MLMDCDAFVKERTLQIYEATDLGGLFYTAISYVWGGLPAGSEILEKDGSFRVYCGHRSDGSLRDDGGPINMKLLEYVCQWTLDASGDFVWLDRLCILQTSKADKDWQIKQMYDIYKQCHECVVLPAGLQRPTSVFDETGWSNRAWTFQEAILTWQYAVVLTADWDESRGLHWMIPGECHWQYLHMLFINGAGSLEPSQSLDGTECSIPRLVLGRNKSALNTLATITQYLVYNESVQKGGKDEELINQHDIYQLYLTSIQMRTSSRPVDIVFSIMGLVGVNLHVGCFRHHERFRATLALVEGCLRLENGKTTFFDVPLWKKLDIQELQSLEELADWFDCQEDADLIPETEWQYLLDSESDEYKSPEEHAEAVARCISPTCMLDAYHDREKVVFEYEGEIIELCQLLDLKGRTCIDESHRMSYTEPSSVIFGWSITRKTMHPLLRLYMFEIGHLLGAQKSR
ncbi:hypothetical protein VKT23_014144 [Stygiomarasmius scandens]|uniref:Heterokaryon incompatibility domain-containing protein n=1 Tax=Marasmiellus scandens TaxID=2682957 RepID=A0ABR1J3Z7_9AGAR